MKPKTSKVIVSMTKKQTPKKVKAVVGVPRTIKKTLDKDLKTYMCALVDPFGEDAVGARVPDVYAAPTDTIKVRATHTITVNASGAANLIVMPNVALSAVLLDGTSPDFSTMTIGDNSTLGTYWGTTSTTLNNQIGNYRIVGMGVRVTGLSSMTNSQGKFIVGAAPIDSWALTKNFTVGGVAVATNAAITSSVTQNAWGFPNNAGTRLAAQLVNYPGFRVISALELTENEFDIIPRPVDPRAFEFRASADSFIGVGGVGTLAANDTVSGNPAYLALNGFEAVYVSCAGAVASTSTFDVEVVYHLEGRPSITSSTTQSGLIVPSSVKASPSNPLGFMKVVESAVKLPAVRQVIETGASMIHPMLGKLASTVLSLF